MPGEAASFRLPDRIAESAREILDGGKEPATPRDAATVMLLRGGPGSIGTGSAAGDGAGKNSGLEVYMLRRKPSMAFAPGAMVFPGGSVDPRDADEQVAWAGPDAAQWGEVFDAPPELARALVCAAVRETFEESGVLLAGESQDSVVADTTSDEWEADRQALLDHSVSLAELLGRRGLVLRADLLRPWSRWITPVIEPRRFDTRFFAAALPAGQRTRDVGGEASAVAWIAPQDALAAGRRRELALMPPTMVTLTELAACADLDTALTGPRHVAPIIPEVQMREGAVWLTVPGISEYPL
ncbi:MAG TPA: NUDIX hydrolase [Streptosporangiaceae bacterium]|nr:NUDIX hydrolase [Streptosporangiaceae bacterium]